MSTLISTRTTAADEDLDWILDARCRTDGAPLTERFFSEQLDDIAAAKAFCGACPVRDACLDAALARREPWGVWGGELLVNGRIVANKRPRGRPPKVRPDTVCAQSA